MCSLHYTVWSAFWTGGVINLFFSEDDEVATVPSLLTDIDTVV